MNLALSNFAWDTQESEETFDTLKKIGITSIEGVLSKLNSWEELSNDKITEYKSLLDSQGISILSLQSLFYGVKCDSILDEDIFISHFSKLIEYSKLLSVNVLVFGSPSLRKKSTGWDVLLPSIFKKLDHHPLYQMDRLDDCDVASLLRWIKAESINDLPQLDRVDLYETRGCGAILSWGPLGPAIPI
jgi:sugar phosphate isomerase/epimerase